MPYNPYEVNRIMAQTNNSLLSSGELKLRQKHLAMEEQEMPSKISMMEEQTKSAKLSNMQRTLGLAYQYESMGIPKETYWPAMQKAIPELSGIDSKSVNIGMGDKGFRVMYEDPETKDKLVIVNDPETGMPKMEKMPGYKASIPDLAWKAQGDRKNPEVKKARGALREATRPELKYDASGNLVSVNPRDPTDIQQTGIKKEAKALPQDVREDLSQGFVSIDSIGKIEKLLSKVMNAPIFGYAGKAAAKFGSKNYVEFETEVANLKLQIQALIKGIPSNFDVQTVINTLPSLLETDATNQSRINKTKDILRMLITDTIGYYKGLNYQMPDHIIQQATELGVNTDSIQAWDSQKTDINTRFKNDPAMKDLRLGRFTKEGYEVFDDSGNLQGYFD
jgi:hypothetical protein